jgi:hypothetical protein
MVYNTQNYQGFGDFPSSGILENRKHDVSETWSVSVIREWGIETENSSKGPNWVGVFLFNWERKQIISETSCFIFSKIPEDGEIRKTQ